MNISLIKKSLNSASEILINFINDDKNISTIEAITLETIKAFKSGNKVISCGNGGSMSDSMHFAEELTGRFKKDREPLPAMAISDPAYLTCVANDYGYSQTFSRYTQAFIKTGDLLYIFSTSGNSKNIINACQIAKNIGAKVIGLLGKNGGKAKSYCDYSIIIPSDDTARIQEIHIKIVHIIIENIEYHLFKN